MPTIPHVKELIAAVHAAGGKIRRDGRYIDLAAREPLPNALVERLRAAKPELLGALATPAEKDDWHARHREALSHWRALHPEGEAAALAWGELQNRWHRLFGARVPEWQCAGCGEPIGGFDALPLSDGTRVHLDTAHGLDCLAAYGERWCAAATRALAAMGLGSPGDV
jgi:hypothetical protein